MIFLASISSLAFCALCSSIQLGILQCSFGTRAIPRISQNQIDSCFTVLCLPTNQRRSNIDKLLRKRHIIQKHPWIMVIPIKPVLDLSNTLDNLPQFVVPYQTDECSLHFTALSTLSEAVLNGRRVIEQVVCVAVGIQGELRCWFGGFFASSLETVCAGGNGDAGV